MNLDSKLQHILNRHTEIEALLNEASGNDFVKLSKELSELSEIVTVIEKRNKYQEDFKNTKALLEDPSVDDEMKELAVEEFEELKKCLEENNQAIKIALLPKDKDDNKNVILEIRAGTGGDEASIFAGDLFRMYCRFAERNSWRVEVMNASDNPTGGYKEVIANITGDGVFSRLKFESGVHRVQRVPETEANGRIHTSAATIAVLPEAEEVDIVIEDKDIRIDVYRSSGAGGQHVNTTDSAVRITHIPTGTVVTQQDEKSQHKNKAKAMRILRSRIYEIERDKIDSERASNRRNQVGSGDRSERIRTYNYPQGRITDHRINMTLYSLERFMEGEIDQVIDALITEDQAKKLLNFES